MGVERKLEITRKLEKMKKSYPNGKKFGNLLDSSVAMLNLPAPYYCDHGCKGCVTRNNETIKKERKGKLPVWRMLGIISLFAKDHDTKFITINGRGDPFHPEVVGETLTKIMYAKLLGLQSYVFTAGDNLSGEVCLFLAEYEVNVMVSLFGNSFVDAGFFRSTRYAEIEIAENIRRLLKIYKESHKQPEEGTTRIGMNYVLSPSDLDNLERLRDLKKAANENRIYFICNTNFNLEPDASLRELSLEFSDFNSSHTTPVDGVCQMGAGSSITIAANGDIYRCPYMLEGSDGNITEMSGEGLNDIIRRYLSNMEYSCVLRKTRP